MLRKAMRERAALAAAETVKVEIFEEEKPVAILEEKEESLAKAVLVDDEKLVEVELVKEEEPVVVVEKKITTKKKLFSKKEEK
jgi:hypothetical protein